MSGSIRRCGDVVMEVYWLEQSEGDVPTTDDWLSPDEVVRLSTMRIAKRRSDWRLGRWTAKNALAVYLLCLKVPADPQVLASYRNTPGDIRCSGGFFPEQTSGRFDFTQPPRRHRRVRRCWFERECWVVIWKPSNRAATLLSRIISPPQSNRSLRKRLLRIARGSWLCFGARKKVRSKRCTRVCG